MTTTTHVLGVDLAAQPKNTGVVALRRDGDRYVATTVSEPATNDALSSWVTRDTLVGLDAPLGWPVEFVRAITAHDRGEPWPRSVDDDRQGLRYRVSDRFVHDLGHRWPLSASTDLIGVVALRAAALQSRWAATWGQAAPRDGTGPLVETYPAAALRAWALLREGERYKGATDVVARAAQRAVRARVLERVALGAPWLDLTATRDAAIASDHGLDALCSALVALATRVGATHVPRSSDERAAALREGWIHVPATPWATWSELVAALLSVNVA